MKLEKGEVICDKCNGYGYTTFNEQRGKNFYPMKSECTKCFGEGKLDWIEIIVGKRKEPKKVITKTFIYNHGYVWSDCWGEISEDDSKPHKKTYEEIQLDIDPHYRKKIERRIRKNLRRG